MQTESPAADRSRRPQTALEYIDAEEKRAFEGLKNSLIAAAEDVSEKTDLRGIVTRHPVLALGASAALGAVLAPFMRDVLRLGLPVLLGSGRFAGETLGKLFTAQQRAP